MRQRDLHLYHQPLSSASWRVRIGLLLKGVEFTSHLVDLRAGDQRSEAHRARNPMEQVPVLEWVEGGQPRRLSQSLAILSWLDDTCSGPALFPADPYARARALQLAEVVNSGIQPLQGLSVCRAITEFGGDADAWRARWVRKGLVALETMATDDPWLVGVSPSVADICLIPQLANARLFGVPVDDLPRLLAVEARAEAHPAFQGAVPSRWAAAQ